MVGALFRSQTKLQIRQGDRPQPGSRSLLCTRYSYALGLSSGRSHPSPGFVTLLSGLGYPAFIMAHVWKQLIVVGLCLFVGLSIACSPQIPSTPEESTPTTVETTPPTLTPNQIEAMKAFVSTEANLPASEVVLKAATAVSWSDACLGAPQANELCAQVVTPGYRVVFSTPQGDYVVHSDAAIRVMRLGKTPN